MKLSLFFNIDLLVIYEMYVCMGLLYVARSEQLKNS